jgi:hypothetical protein
VLSEGVRTTVWRSGACGALHAAIATRCGQWLRHYGAVEVVRSGQAGRFGRAGNTKSHCAPTTTVNGRVRMVAGGAGQAENGRGHLERSARARACAGDTVGRGSGLERRGPAGFVEAHGGAGLLVMIGEKIGSRAGG